MNDRVADRRPAAEGGAGERPLTVQRAGAARSPLRCLALDAGLARSLVNRIAARSVPAALPTGSAARAAASAAASAASTPHEAMAVCLIEGMRSRSGKRGSGAAPSVACDVSRPNKDHSASGPCPLRSPPT
jgi:hypothetical protein